MIPVAVAAFFEVVVQGGGLELGLGVVGMGGRGRRLLLFD